MSARCVNVSLCASGHPAPPFAMEFAARSGQSGIQFRPSRFLARPGKALGLQAHPVFGGVHGFLPVVSSFDRFGPEHPKFLPDIPFKISS